MRLDTNELNIQDGNYFIARHDSGVWSIWAGPYILKQAAIESCKFYQEESDERCKFSEGLKVHDYKFKVVRMFFENVVD